MSRERRGTLAPGDDPRKILALEPNATDEDIRAAYLKKVKEHPPERSPEAFERIRDAYELLRDPRRRARSFLLSVDPEEPLVSLVADRVWKRQFLGPGPWLDVLREK